MSKQVRAAGQETNNRNVICKLLPQDGTDLTSNEKLHYTRFIITCNPADKLLPMTHKNNHGISLCVWAKSFRAFGIGVKFRYYNHHVAASGYSYEYPATELVLNNI